MGNFSRNAIVLAGGLTLLCGLAACGSDTDSGVSTVQLRSASAKPVDGASPLSAYVDTAEQRKKVTTARASLVAACMQRLGFAEFKTVESKEQGAEFISGRRYLYIEPEQAARTGYAEEADAADGKRRTADQARAVSMAERRALTGGDVTLDSGQTPPQGGCTGEASRTLTTGASQPDELLVWRLMAEAAAPARKDAEVLRVVADWSTCMKQRGFSYATPEDAWNDPRWVRQAGPAATDEERKAASADMECKDQSGYAVALSNAQNANEQKLIEQHADALKALARNRGALLRNAEIVLQGGQP
ncbi:hypothetical protein [Nonomuraea candida]|uniref:hypothetical protein n=1 Tax=Nonomuraea candida TaxID=359159 RepID=UPI0012FC7764|nr:hypothetical protein [Nonomuraea candida]